MKEDGENGEDGKNGKNGGDGLHTSKRLRLSILRSHNRGVSRRGLDSAGPSHGASSSTTVNLPSISYRGVQVGSSEHAELTSVSDDSFRHTPGNTSGLGTHDDSAPAIEENISSVTDTLQLDVFQQGAEAGNDPLDLPCETPDEGGNEQRESPGRQLEDGVVHSVESIPAEPDAELSAGTGGPVGPSEGHDAPLSSGEEEADGVMQGGEISGIEPGNHLEQEADLTRVQEEEPEVRSLVSQQQDEASSHNVVTLDQSGTPVLGQILDTRVEVVEAHETQSAHAEARNPVIETVVLSEDDEEAQSEDPMLTASAFAEPSLTAEDLDAFAPEPHLAPRSTAEEEAGTSRPEQLGTQLDSEGTTCPICMEPWTSTGNHRICSLACGHLFGKACIKRWLKMAGRKQGKCPQCNKRARVEDLRTLYVPRIAVMDEESQSYMEEAGSLRTENEKLKKQVVDLREEVRRTQAVLRALTRDQRDAFTMFGSSRPRPSNHRGHDIALTAHQIHVTGHNASRSAAPRAQGNVNHDQSGPQSGQSIRERPNVLQLLSMRSSDASRPTPEDQQNGRRLDGRNGLGTGSHAGMIVDVEQRREDNIAARPMRSFPSLTVGDSQHLEKGFVLEDDRSLNGAKVFDMDAQSQLLLVSGRPPDSMTSSGLTKMSLLALSEGECINLPSGTGAIRDIRIAPTGTRAPGKLALVASLGKRLSIFSLDSNNVVITYMLPNPSWACAWDPCDPNRLYTGLQNGTLLTFDMRQTSSPLDTLKSPSSTPIHTLQYVPKNPRATNHKFEGGGLLSASSSTFLFWPGIDQPREKRPVCLSQPGGSSVCVSVSYNSAVDVMVASFRPKPTTVPSNDGASSSTTLPTHSQADFPSQSTPSVLPETASTASVGVHIPTHFAYARTTCGLMGGPGSFHTSWEQQGAMVGHKSQAVLSRTAIVNEWTETGTGADQSSCLFASGDEGSNSVWLWNLTTRAVKQMLTPHPYSPVLDIRTAHVAGVDLLGCMSERTLQLYRRVPG
ncbi:hypothetical protein KC19_11G116300 [Ceratodon purpureus]|uniref:RING-type E3 ubiquitin transferase n=1 Tax=Ceratodon purpureus TaxID=3225 RepID=A0A8T0GHN4_CERPU|nr:hypothetical protein KC19_11G116300 [Ceratodon purpureus]